MLGRLFKGKARGKVVEDPPARTAAVTAELPGDAVLGDAVNCVKVLGDAQAGVGVSKAKLAALCQRLAVIAPRVGSAEYVELTWKELADCCGSNVAAESIPVDNLAKLFKGYVSDDAQSKAKTKALIKKETASEELDEDIMLEAAFGGSTRRLCGSGLTRKNSDVMHDAVERWREFSDPVAVRAGNFDCILEGWRIYAPEFKWDSLNPDTCSGLEFASHVAECAKQHAAVQHDYLRRLSAGEFAFPRAALRDWVVQYESYSQGFTKQLSSVMDLLQDPAHRELLQENLDEENGSLEEEDGVQLLKQYGIDPESVRGVPHKELFSRFLQAVKRDIAEFSGLAGDDDVAHSPGKWLSKSMGALYKVNEEEEGDRAETLAYMLGALGAGTETIVSRIYAPVLAAVKANTELSPEEYAFLPLHIDIDDGHAQALNKVGGDIVGDSRRARLQFLLGAASALVFRKRFWDRMLVRALSPDWVVSKLPAPPPAPAPADTAAAAAAAEDDVSSTANTTSTATLYDKQSTRWVRDSPNVLSDYTGREALFELCAPVSGKRILDLGCGEGYCARQLRRKGAAQIVASDISAQMIQRARDTEAKQQLGGLEYHVCDARTLVDSLKQSGVSPLEGSFDIVTAVFVFNYVTIQDMLLIMSHVSKLLRPGGRFVFSVPHPCLKFWNRKQAGKPFYFQNDGENAHKGYFNRDSVAEGRIWTRDGQVLNVRSFHKTVADYLHAIRDSGLHLGEMRELTVTDTLLELDEDFFGPLHQVPMHIGFSCVMPAAPAAKAAPPALLWPAATTCAESVSIPWSSGALDEALACAQKMRSDRVSPDMYQVGMYGQMPALDAMGGALRQAIATRGAALVTALPLAALQQTHLDDEKLLALYVLLCAHSGLPFMTDRGRLHMVRDKGLDTKDDDVLFSHSNIQSGWHTDSTRLRVFPDVVGLMCLEPSPVAGEGALRLTSGVAAWHSLQAILPQFLLDELQRPVIRDLVEAGNGSPGEMDRLASIARNKDVLAQRIKRNSFPIFAVESAVNDASPLTCRYMREWIESGHKRAGVPLSPLLKLAMDVFDAVLESAFLGGSTIERRLERSEMAFTNNHVVLHDRTAFQKGSNRLQCRVWLDWR